MSIEEAFKTIVYSPLIWISGFFSEPWTVAQIDYVISWIFAILAFAAGIILAIKVWKKHGKNILDWIEKRKKQC